MVDPNIKTKVVHSESKHAWNVVGVKPLGGKYKIARVPYEYNPKNTREVGEAKAYAEFISWCFNNSDKISKLW